MIPQNEKFLLDILNLIKEGKNPTQIARQFNLSKQAISYYIRRLKNQNLIKKVSYGVWEATSKNYTHHTSKNKEVRGHAFIWKIQLPKEMNWSNLKFPHEIKGNNLTTINLKQRKIWLGKKSIIIYEPDSFFEASPIEVRKLAVYKLLEIIEEIEKKLKISLKTKEGYLFQPKREHYSLIKNNLAIQCNRTGEKIYVKDKGELWFLIDNSYNLDEAEFYTTTLHDGLINSTGAQGYFNSHKSTKWKVTPDFVLNNLTKLTEAISQSQAQLLEYKKQNQKHLKLIQEYRKENKIWRKQFQTEQKDNKNKDLRKWM